MTCQIVNWKDIAEDYKDATLILGNGASIAVNHGFSYQSLFKYAEERHNFSNDNNRNSRIIELFKAFDSEDFELILRMLWQAKIVNEKIGYTYKKLEWSYDDVKSGLIKTVRDVHPNYSDNGMNLNLQKIFEFLTNFKTVLSLNYDLIAYWALMLGNENNNGNVIKDCFNSSGFDDDWEKFKKPMITNGQKHVTLIFYPHGNLVLFRDDNNHEYKIKSSTDSNRLLDSILDKWDEGKGVPIFISEGTSKQKVESIKSSYYLSVVYWEVIPEDKEKLVIYGWSMGEHDVHILKQMKNCGLKRIAISVYNQEQDYCEHVKKMIRKHLGKDIRIQFFDSQSPECWNN